MTHRDQILCRLKELGVDDAITKTWKTLHQIQSTPAMQKKQCTSIRMSLYVVLSLLIFGLTYCIYPTSVSASIHAVVHWIAGLGRLTIAPLSAEDPVQPTLIVAGMNAQLRTKTQTENQMITKRSDLLVGELVKKKCQMQAREEMLKKQMVLLKALYETVNQKVQQLDCMRKEWQPLLQMNRESSQKRIIGLVQLCETMNSKKAAERLNLLNVQTLLFLFKEMNKRKAAAILEQMDPGKVKELLTELAKTSYQDLTHALPDSMIREGVSLKGIQLSTDFGHCTNALPTNITRN